MLKNGVAIISIFIFSHSIQAQNEQCISVYYNKLVGLLDSLLETNYKPIPRLIYYPLMTSNAQWTDSAILIGQGFFNKWYITDDDRLSIIYHEYNHYLNSLSNKYPCRIDSCGNIFQSETGIFFEKPISPIEIEIDLYEILETEMSEAEKQQCIASIKKPVMMRFIYAPSNLSLDELECYRAELQANEIGIYKLSPRYEQLILYRIQLEELNLRMRLQYEIDENLNIDGTIKN